MVNAGSESLNLNLNDYVEVPSSLVLYDVGGFALIIAVLNELTDAEWTMLLSRWFHSTTVLEKKEFRNCSVLHGWTTKHQSLFLM